MKRLGIHVSGLVQGVGFRPFLHRLAMEHRIGGSVRNTPSGVIVEAEGPARSVISFLSDIRDRAPMPARIERIAVSTRRPKGESSFEILPSEGNAVQSREALTTVPKDLAPCDGCLAEMRDPANRRYRYPFITCNMCGPRFTIVEHLPFDRHHTSMADFPMCSACVMEFTSPLNRRYHAQTISCSDCGPTLTWTSPGGEMRGDTALAAAIQALADEKIIAVKGVGGYQLLCLARSSSAVERIRHLKERPMKPLAVMAPHVTAVQEYCHLDATAAAWLTGPVAPILILAGKQKDSLSIVSPYVAPMTTDWGVMLPNSPLYHLIMDAMNTWLVVTSANRSGAPTEICDDRIPHFVGHMVDGILSHNRRITHLADDSVMRPDYTPFLPHHAHRGLTPVRLGRGLAPIEVPLQNLGGASVVAVGGHQKASFAILAGKKAVVSPYLGDWSHEDTATVFNRELTTTLDLYGVAGGDLERIDCLACDSHPTYGSSLFAGQKARPLQRVQHHLAHLESLIAEHSFVGKALGVVWDGTGFGDDGTMWGGEFFLVDGDERQRVASIRPIPLWGGDKATVEPRRVALGLLWETFASDVKNQSYWQEHTTDQQKAYLPLAYSLQSGMVYSSSIGRLFDGMAALLGLYVSGFYEAQAAMALESLARDGKGLEPLPLAWHEDDQGLWRLDWRDMVRLAVSYSNAEDRARFAACFHATLVKVIVDLASKLNVASILLTGGVFQNALLTHLCHNECSLKGLRCLTHVSVSPGDGGLALGQLRIVARSGHVSRSIGSNRIHL